MATPNALTPAATFSTNVPFAKPGSSTNGSTQLEADTTKKVTVQATAEFLEYTFPGSRFSTKSKVKYIYDKKGQPLIFSISTDQVLYVNVNVDGAAKGFRSIGLAPGTDLRIQAFDVFEAGENVLLVLAGQKGQGQTVSTKIYYSMFLTPSLACDPTGKITNNVFTSLNWRSIEGRLTKSVVTSLTCTLQDTETSGLLFSIVAGIEATATKEGSFYTFGPIQSDKSDKEPWVALPLATSTEKARSCCSAVPSGGLGQGVVYVAEHDGKDSANTCNFRGRGITTAFPMSSSPTSASCSVNFLEEDLYTDITIATSNGILFYDAGKLDANKPNSVLGAGTSFKEVVCSNEKASDDTGHWSIFALSAHDELWFFEGQREKDEAAIRWSEPSVPIRAGVRHIDCELNPRTLNHELVFVKDMDDEIRHLSRSGETYLWNEKPIISTPLESKKLPPATRSYAFVINLLLHDGQGTPVPEGYTVELSASPTFALINGRTRNLDEKSQSVTTNSLGRITIAIPTNGTMSASDVVLTLKQFATKAESISIQPAQRFQHIISQVKTGDDLKYATTTDGTPLFTPTQIDAHKNDFDIAANVLGQLPGLNSKSHPTRTLARTAVTRDDTKYLVCYEKTGNNSGSQIQDTRWITDVTDGIASAIGEVFEFLKNCVKTVVKVALKVVGPVLTFIVRIGVRVLKFALEGVSKVLTCAIDVLQAILPWDLSGLRDWLTFRYRRVADTQKALATLLTGSLDMTSRFLKTNNEAVKSQINILEQNFQAWLGPPGAQVSKDQSSRGSGIIDNPIITTLLKFNPLSWLLEAVDEELGDSIPHFSITFDGSSLSAIPDTLLKIFGNAKDTIGSAVSDPSHAADALVGFLKAAAVDIFAAIKAAIFAILDGLVAGIDGLKAFLNHPWDLGELSGLWRDLTDCDLSAMNFVTYLLAQVMELFNPSSKEGVLSKLNVDEVVKGWDSMQLPTVATVFGGDSSPQTPQQHLESSAPAKKFAMKSMAVSQRVASTPKEDPSKRTAKAVIATMHALKSVSSCISILAEGFIEKTDHKLPGPKDLTGINGPIIGFTIGAGAFSFGFTMVEFAMMAAYFSEDEKRREGFDNIGWEMMATFIRIPMSISSMEGLAAGNILVSVACIKRAWQAEEKHLADYCEIGASAAGTLSALAFCFRTPHARVAGWTLWSIDAVANAVILEEEIRALGLTLAPYV